VFVAVMTEEIPRIHPAQRETISVLGEEFYQIILHFGFMEVPDVPTALENLVHDELSFDPTYTTYFFGRETLIVTERAGMAIWRERLFALMSRNARSATAFFCIPTERIIELGVQVEL
jgi:KUP system potassium uptake protein